MWLATHVLREPPDEPLHPDNVTLATVRRFYWKHHAQHIRSAHVVKNAFAWMTVYLHKVARDQNLDGAPKAGWLTLARQEGFMRWCRDTRQLSAKSIATYLTQIKAGMNFCARPRLMTDAEGRER